MERITFEGNFCDIACCTGEPGLTTSCPTGYCDQRRTWERLKRYEDTGLSPEEVMIYAKSRTEGRVLELPCRIGATVYELRRKYEDYRGRKYDHSLTGCSNFRRFIRSDEIYVAPKRCTKSDFNWLGKTVFLSEEEAKATLEERKNA